MHPDYSSDNQPLAAPSSACPTPLRGGTDGEGGGDGEGHPTLTASDSQRAAWVTENRLMLQVGLTKKAALSSTSPIYGAGKQKYKTLIVYVLKLKPSAQTVSAYQ